MSVIVVGDLAYRHPDKTILFEHIDIAVGCDCKVSLVGDNGVGKSTLLRIIAGEAEPASGTVYCASKPYYVPQNIGATHKTIADVLNISEKLHAIAEIAGGSTDQRVFDLLADDWNIEFRARQALEQWGLGHVSFDSQADLLSGGERTKLYLAGMVIHSPQIVLLDEPTNHLDRAGRTMLYDFIERSKATFVIVSHDIMLLNLLKQTYELTAKGARLYGGNYDFYRSRKDTELEALSDSIHAEEKALRLARRKAQEARERQQRRESAGRRTAGRGGQPRILANAKAGHAEQTSAKLKDTHQRKITESGERLGELRGRRDGVASLKLNFDDATLHTGKLLFEAQGINMEYSVDRPLWDEPLDFALYSGDRLHLTGDNGSGKTTLIKLLTGELQPTHGTVRRTEFSYVYLDQNCSAMDSGLTVVQMAGSFNAAHLADHEIKLRLNRALFPRESWDKSCRTLSGGERMRLYLCCLMISNEMPDLFILDEPTNNLDISSLRVLIDVVSNYRGTILAVSHDAYFIENIHTTSSLTLTSFT